MDRHEIKDEDWERIKDLLPGQPGSHGGTGHDTRRFVNAIFYISKTGVPWRDLPERFGKWNSIWQRFNRWCRKGVWRRVFQVLQDPDLEWIMIDSTVVRAHPHAAGHNTPENHEDLGYSRGGFGTKIHVAYDALGNPVNIHLSPGQDADIKHAAEALGECQPEAVIGDKGYDSDAFAAEIESRGAEVVIPPKSNRKNPREYDKEIYKERNKAERGMGMFKQFRRVATRYEKKSKNFLGFVLFAAIAIWLR